MSAPIVELTNLSKRYGNFTAVDHLDLHINKGEIFGLLGPNGAGKTTTILMMLGLTEPTVGSAMVCGHDATKEPIEVKKKVGYLPDSVGFYDAVSGLDNLLFIARLNGIPEQEAKSHVEDVLEAVGLTEHMHKKVATYSRGMKQRLGLADVLVKNPDVVILDEPTLGIDPSGVKDFLDLIRQLSRKHGLTVLLSSHHLHHVQQVCDRVGIFVDGKLLAQGNIDSLSKELFDKEGYTISVGLPALRHDDAAEGIWTELRKLFPIQELTFEGSTLHINSKEDITSALVRFLVLRDLEINEVQRKVYGLDEIYHKYFENRTISTNAGNNKSLNFFKKSIFRKHVK